jgi:hypothetical protein
MSEEKLFREGLMLFVVEAIIMMGIMALLLRLVA